MQRHCPQSEGGSFQYIVKLFGFSWLLQQPGPQESQLFPTQIVADQVEGFRGLLIV